MEQLIRSQLNHDFPEKVCDEKSEYSAEDRMFLKIPADSVVKQDGNYQLRLPFRQEEVHLPNNRMIAEQRANTLMKRFHTDNMLFADYKGIHG